MINLKFEATPLIPLSKQTHKSIQWNLPNPDTLGTISGVHFMEVSWFQGLVNMHANITFGTTISILNMEVSWFQRSWLMRSVVIRYNYRLLLLIITTHTSVFGQEIGDANTARWWYSILVNMVPTQNPVYNIIAYTNLLHLPTASGRSLQG